MVRDRIGWAGMHNACMACRAATAGCLEVLLEACGPACLDMRDRDGWAPVHVAAR